METEDVGDEKQPDSTSSSSRIVISEIVQSDLKDDNTVVNRHGSPYEIPSYPVSFQEQAVQITKSDEGLGQNFTDATTVIVTEKCALLQPENPCTNALFGSVKFLAPWLPAVDPDIPTFRTRRSSRRVVILTCISIAFTVFMINLALAIISWTRYDLSNDHVVTLYQGDCTISKRINTGLHVVINILSTLLLSSSNLCLQLFLAPTRPEVDRAHARQQWLDIGVTSWRNFMNLSSRHKCVWMCLAMSSVPIHFLYNSVVFSTVSTNPYTYMTVTQAFITPQNTSLTFPLSNGSTVRAPLGFQVALDTEAPNGYSEFGYYGHLPAPGVQQQILKIHEDLQINPTSYTKLDNYECLATYGTSFSWRPPVLFVSEKFETAVEHNTSLLTWGYNGADGNQNAITWTNDPRTNWQTIGSISPADAEAWARMGNRIQYCLRRVDSPGNKEFHDCRVQSAPIILSVVALFNITKCLCMLWLLFMRAEKTMCTLGDAIASFLEIPDPYTRNCGVATKAAIQSSWQKQGGRIVGAPQKWQLQRTAWYRAASPKRWWFTMTTSLIILIGGIIVLSTGLAVVAKYQGNITLSTLWSLGFGATSNKMIISWNQPTAGTLALLCNIVIVNIWQVVVSLCYMAQNTLLSCLLIAGEWSGFSSDRKSLRVSHPRGIQRSTYFVNMPLKYGGPTMALFAIEHWLLSQSTFIIRVVNINIMVDPVEVVEGYTTSGFSIMPAIAALILPSFLLIAQCVHAFLRRYSYADSIMPLVSTCSAAISSNCHRPHDDVDAHLLPVQWGVIGQTPDGVQLCSLTTSRDVFTPLTGSKVLMAPL